jgi:serine/threonine protein kinase
VTHFALWGGAESFYLTFSRLEMGTALVAGCAGVLAMKYRNEILSQVVMTKLSSKGSLKDAIYKSNPIQPFRKKYERTGTPLSLDKIAKYGRQILEGIKFLKSKNLPYRNLHTGNVIIEDGRAMLTGYENPILGYRPKLFHRVRRPILRTCPLILLFAVLFSLFVALATMQDLTISHFSCRASIMTTDV